MKIWKDSSKQWEEFRPGVASRVLSQEGFSRLALYRFKPSSGLPLHKAKEKHFGLFIKGSGVFETAKGKIKVQAGDGFFINPGEDHGYTSSSKEESIVLEIFIPSGGLSPDSEKPEMEF
jgi:quercetin dioxygenase-like cupin family protein